ncbi:hypothetical protein DV711_09360 [Motiliproteus coralliicola]|uniref:Thioredoxin domain-containing protein n=1 Tax=Motiliproteus coralliicola TaxID=2283196 RepID=A0A369WNH8_9GAMM|nr:thioredoxin domain-containing protein [Motiliproteus coralliicola]RDE22773.1 hypothetical protein DV711_09360 [Motiliproteus coralliicola]
MSGTSNSRKGSLGLNIAFGLALLGAAIFFMQPQQSTAPGDPAVLKLGGETLSRSELPAKLRQALERVELSAYRQRQQILQAAAVDLYVARVAEDNQESIEQVRQRLLPRPQISEQEIQAFYQGNRERLGASLEQTRDEIGRYLFRRKVQQQHLQLIDKLVRLEELQLLIEAPTTEAIAFDLAGFPSQGPDDAKVTLVEFADYQCPHCKRAHEILKALLPQYLDRVRYVYLDFPINRSGISRKIAEGAVCADRQQHYWEYQDKAFEQQTQLTEASVTAIAEQLQLNLPEFNRCLADEATAAQVKRAEAQAIQAGLSGTPSFFINGHVLEPRQNLADELRAQLNQALEG